jgi:lipid-A-disaccharide synthase-like uncharacterized protein/protein tyrosine phosphatase (PTP) superfamily phosphohydrolase (DUF442 family)
MNNTRKRTLGLSLVLAFTTLVILGGWYFFSPPRQFAVVDAGILYRSGQGRPNQVQNLIRRYGIKTIICLREAKDDAQASRLAAEARVAKQNGVEMILRATNSHLAVPEQAQVDFLRLVQNPAGQPVLLHCAQGKHRTGFFVALYRMVVNEWSFGKAIKEMDSFGYDLATHQELLDSLRKVDPDYLRRRYHFKTHPAAVNRDPINLVFMVSLWTLFGFAGQFFFFSRFLVQWIATEKRGRTHIPVAFWYLSLLGGTVLTVYAVGKADVVITLGQGLGCLIYVRNLMIIQRNREQNPEIDDHAC